MKIAVLLRGQPRFSQYGAAFFKKFVQERFPEHEFSIFVGTWKTISNVMDTPQELDAVVYGREYDQRLLTLDETIDLVRPWGPRKFTVIPEHELFGLLKDIYATLLNDQERYDAIREILETEPDEPNGKNLVAPGCLDVVFESEEFLVTNLVWGNKIELADPVYELRRNLINNQYLLGQIYSAGKSYEIFESYAKENNYEPDFIWSTRMDMIHWYNSPEGFDTMKRDLTRMESEKDYPCIFADQVEIHNGRPWASDYNFYMLPDTAKHLLDDIQEKFKSWILEDTRLLMSVIGTGSGLQHALWLNFFRKCSVIPLNPFIKPTYSEVIRPKENIDQIISETLLAPTTVETVEDFINKTIKEYPYPGANAPVPRELIDKYFDMLSTD